MSTALTLIAHAPTRTTREAGFPAADEPIDAPGRAKAAALAGALRRVDAAWTSPALRARETADALGLDAAVEPALRDMAFGEWTGRSLAAVAAAEPAAVAQWLGDPRAAPHGGDSVADVLGRVSLWLDALGSAEGRLVAVTHPAVMRAAILHVLAAPPASFWRIDIAPLSQVRLRQRGGRWTLLSVTDGSAAGWRSTRSPSEDPINPSD